MATREYIVSPSVYVCETGTRSEIVTPGVYVSETVTAASTAAVVTLYALMNVG